jgi:hypothetical protein
VTQAVNAFGFGKFQVKLSLFTGLCWMADSMEMTILSILSPALHCDWHITRYQQALTTTVNTVNVLHIGQCDLKLSQQLNVMEPSQAVRL